MDGHIICVTSQREDIIMRTNKKVLAIVAVIALVAILGVCLIACNADSYTKKLEKAGYTVSSYKGENGDEAKIEWGVVGIKVGSTVTVVKFKSTDDAKAAEESHKGSLLKVGDVYRNGKIVIWGDAEGVKAAK